MKNLSPAFFLANSWFWCIGGFFPILLYYDFGQISFYPFFVFNVLGAALFGFILNARSQTKLLGGFLPSAQVFSAVVAGYHLVFICWISVLMHSIFPISGFLIATSIFFLFRRHLFTLSIAVFAVTIALFGFALFGSTLSQMSPSSAMPTPSTGFIHYILPLAFGFLLAPYFDLTFHRAYMQSTKPKLTFFIGIGGLFSVLLLCMYFVIPILMPMLTSQGLSQPALHLIVILLIVQTAFTTAAHLHELSEHQVLHLKYLIPALIFITTLCVAHVGILLFMPDFAFDFGDLIYRVFLFIIGAIFPVLLLFGGLNRNAWIAMLILTPCYTLGFLVSASFAVFLSLGMAGLVIVKCVAIHSHTRRVYDADANQIHTSTSRKNTS